MKNHWANTALAACCLLAASIPSLAQACTTDPLSQPAVISAQSTASTAPPASELACSSPIGDTVFLNSRYFSFSTGMLERVIISGQSVGSSQVVCIGESCQVVLTGLRDAGERAAAILGGWRTEILNALFPPIPLSVCSSDAPASDSDIYSTTSHSTSEKRLDAARAAMAWGIGINAANSITMHEREIKVTFSDGGSQTYIYIVANPRASREKQPVDLVVGDGISKCPPANQ